LLYTAAGDVALGIADAAADDPAPTDATTRIATTTTTAKTTAAATLPPIRMARNDVLPYQQKTQRKRTSLLDGQWVNMRWRR